MFTPVCIDETWGTQKVAGRLEPRQNFADAKSAIVSAVDMQVRSCVIRGHAYEVRTLPPRGLFDYRVVVSWHPEGADGIIVSFVFGVEVN